MQTRVLLQIPLDWKAPEGLSNSLSRPNIKYEIVHGGQEHAVGVLGHIRAIAPPSFNMLYSTVLKEKASTGVIRAKHALDGITIGTWDLRILSPASSSL